MTQDISLANQVATRRPILTHLNADTSWLISFPRSKSAQNDINKHGRKFYHVLLDAWLSGEVVAIFRWFMTIAHAEPSYFKTMNDVRGQVKRIEDAAGSTSQNMDDGEVDLIVVSTYLDDHCHKETLEQCTKDTPVLTVATTAVLKWGHFDNIELMPEVDLDAPERLWREKTSSKNLPEFLRIGQLPSGERYPAVHFAMYIAYSGIEHTFDSNDSIAETIIYTPHGFYANRLQNLLETEQQGKSTMLALLHGLDPSWYPSPANLGVQNGWEVALRTNAKYWIPTHDEHAVYGGLNGFFQTKHKKMWTDIKKTSDDEGKDIICRELGNGESFVLA